MADSIAVPKKLGIDDELKAWLKLDRLVVDRAQSTDAFATWLTQTPQNADGVTATPGDANYKRAFQVIEKAIEQKFFSHYRAYLAAKTFDTINEEQFVGFLAHKSTPEGGIEGDRLMKIKNSLLPVGMAALINRILTTNGVTDSGYTNSAAIENAIRTALTHNNPLDIFLTKAEFTSQKVARIPTKEELLLPAGAGHDKNNIGGVRSAHCDNNAVLGQRPMYTLNPQARANRENLYYLWIELLSAFDKNQTESLQQSGLWSKLDDKRRAPSRIAYVEFTAGRAHEDPPLEKARLVYDYVNNRVYVTCHYDSPNHADYLKWMGMKAYFLVELDAPMGKDTVTTP